MLESLITSKTRIKLLMKFFLNSNTMSYLRDLEAEFGGSTNIIRIELNRMEEDGLLQTHWIGNKKMFRANAEHPLFSDIHSLLLKHTGINHVVSKVINGLGGLQQAHLVGDFARGKDNPVIDIILVGHEIDVTYLSKIIYKAEKTIDRHIRYMILEPAKAERILNSYPEALLLWESS